MEGKKEVAEKLRLPPPKKKNPSSGSVSGIRIRLHQSAYLLIIEVIETSIIFP